MRLKNSCIDRKILIILSVFYAAVLPVSAQINIDGKVLNENREPVAHANVLILKSKDSSLLKGTVSDKNGLYNFQNVKTGTYLISITSTGFQQAYIPIFTLRNEDGDRQIGESILIKAVMDLKAVSIVASKPLFEQKIDRTVINVATSITYAGGTALEVLERSPGVFLDLQNNTILLNGKEGVVVMINNKINRMPATAIVQMLAGMSSNTIERIELITTPPANFDAEGNAGYINIILKSTTESGINGSYSLTGGYSRGEITQSSLNLNYRKGPLNIFGDISYSRSNYPQLFDVYKKVMYQGVTKETYTDMMRRSVQSFLSAKIGADYTLSDKTIIGVLLSGYSNHQLRGSGVTANLFMNLQLDTSLKIKNTVINNWNNISGNINLQHSLSTDERVVFNLNYDYYISNNPAVYSNKYYDAHGNFFFERNVESSSKTPIKLWVAAADYSKKLSGQVNMEAGLKGTLSGFTNRTEVNTLFQNVWQKDQALSTTHFLQENVIAGYVVFSIAFDTKTSIKTGLRYEHTITDLDSDTKINVVKRSYGKVFPSVFLSHDLNKNNKVNLSYSKRITRPSFNNMAPITVFFDPYTFFNGNPALQPTIANSFTTSYSYRRNMLSLSFTNESKPITAYVPKIDPATNMQLLTPENQKSRVTFATGITTPFTVTTSWTGQVNITGNFQKLNVYIKGVETVLKQQYAVATLMQTVALPKNFTFETSGSFNSGGFFGIFKLKPFGAFNAGIQKRFPGNKSSLRLNGTNILNTQVTNISVNLPEHNLVNTFYMYFTFPSYRLTYTRDFGNSNLRQMRKRVTGAEEVKQRVE